MDRLLAWPTAETVVEQQCANEAQLSTHLSACEPQPEVHRQPLLDLSRQQRNMACLRPLILLEHNKLMHLQEGPDGRSLFEKLDATYLMLNALDFMMERTTVASGASQQEVWDHVAQLAGELDRELTEPQCLRVAEVVVGALDNRANGYGEFGYPYFHAPSRSMREVRFRLVTWEPDLEGVYRYRPAREGYLVYLGMLDLSGEDAQEFMQKWLEMLMARGRYEDAADIARNSRTLSIEYRQHIADRLMQANRAPGAVNWSRDMTPYLDRAREHVQRRQREDQAMAESVRNNLANVDTPSTRQSMVKLHDLLKDCATVRARLLTEITVAPGVFLARQTAVFRARRPTGLPDLDSRILPQLMELPTATLAQFAETELSCFYPAQRPGLYDLNTVFALLLEARPEEREPQDDDGELVAPVELPPQFSPQTIEAAHAWARESLRGAQGLTLKELLQRADEQGLDENLRRCIFFVVLRTYAPSETPFPDILVTAEGRFKLALVQGSNLVFTDRSPPDDD